MHIVYEEIYFNALNRRQIRFDKQETLLFVQVKENQIDILADLETGKPSLFCQIENIPGDKIIDFHAFEHYKLVTLSQNGLLCCYSFQKGTFKQQSMKILFKNKNEKACSLAVSSTLNKIGISSFQYSGEIEGKEDEKSPKKRFKMCSVNLHLVEYDFITKEFIGLYDGPIALTADFQVIEDMRVEIQIDHQLQNQPILVVALCKKRSNLSAFLLSESEILEISQLSTKEKIEDFVFNEDRLWVVCSDGEIKSLA